MSDLVEQAAYIPWKWYVASTNPTASTCPSTSAILGTFAVVNIIVGALSIAVGHRKVTKLLTCKLCGRRNKKSWTWTWILVVGLQLGANALIAYIIKKTPGYERSFSIWQLTLFFTARPRIAWILGIPLSFFYNCCSDSRVERGDYRELNSYDGGYRHHSPRRKEEEPGDARDFTWRSFAFSQFIAEIVLQLVTAYTMVTTVAFAASHGYYVLGNLSGPVGHNAHIVYAAALYWLCGLSVLLTVVLMAFIYVAVTDKGITKNMHCFMTAIGVVMIPFSWMASWLFWAGYVRVAGELYCPPKLELHAFIWVFFSFCGIILGIGPG